MGHYNGKNYYRGKEDADLQWLEDGANLVIALFVHGLCSCVIGVVQICVLLFKLITSDKTG
jgi:hypothetical protein